MFTVPLAKGSFLQTSRATAANCTRATHFPFEVAPVAVAMPSMTFTAPLHLPCTRCSASVSRRPLRRYVTRRRGWRRVALMAQEEPPPTRLFTNVAPNERGELKRVNASEASCAALIAGTMIGAGVLALPNVTAPAGFIPSSAALTAVWAYMVGSALLLTEVSLSTVCSLGRPSGVSLLSLGRLTLGRAGGAVTALAYTLLHYAILTAYTAQGGAVLHELWELVVNSAPDNSATPQALQVAFALALGGTLFALPDAAVERANNVLVAGVLCSFAAVLASLASVFDPSALTAGSHPEAVVRAVPVFFVSCVYHNVVGTVASRLEGDLARIRRAVIAGSAVPLAMFLVYNAAVLGAGDPPATATWAVDAFSLLAIVTSFVGFVAGLVDLWSDVRISLLGQTPDAVQRSQAANYAATVLPPALCCVLFQDVFLRALDVAGTYAITILFGVLPAAMAWKARTEQKGFPRALPGGRPVLAAMAAAPSVLIVSKLSALYGALH